MAKGDDRDVVAEARSILEENPRAADVAIEAARALLASGEPDAVHDLLALVDPGILNSNKGLLDLQASLALIEERHDEALEFLRKQAELTGSGAHPALRLAAILVNLERPQAAIEWARKARDRDPDDVSVSLEAITVFARAGAATDAHAEAARALSAHKGDPRLQLRLGLLARNTGDLDLAVDALAAAALNEDPSPEAFLHLGLIFWDHVRGPEFARSLHQMAIECFGSDPANLRELGWIELLSGNRPAGTALLLASLSAFDREPPPLILEQWAGEALAGTPEEIVALLDRPLPVAIQHGAGRYFGNRGRFELAESWFREALQEAPDAAAIRVDLAHTLMEQLERPDEAAAELDEIDLEKVKDPQIRAEIAHLRMILGSDREPGGEPAVMEEAGRANGSGVLAMHAHPLDPDSAEGRAWRGDDALVSRVMRILARPALRSVLLVGETGVGKSSLVAEVARRIAAGRCPERLGKHRILELSPTALQTDIKYLGEWQTKITRLVREIRESPGTILYIPRFHHLLGAGATLAHEEDMVGALAPLLAADQLVVIADGNPEPLRRMMRTRPELDRALTQVELPEPDRGQARKILLAARSWIRGDDGPRIEASAVDRTIDLCIRFLRREHFPAKGIDLLRATHERVRESGRNLVTPEDVAYELSAKTGLPRFLVLDSEMLDLEQTLGFFRERILGQEEALTALQDTVARIKTGLQDPERPLATYLFTGPTGVGKTETAKVLAAYLFGDEKRMIRFDMSEFADHLAVERLIEARDQQIGSRGHLTGAVREHPLSVILFDEIEKAHPRVFDLLLQVLGEGRLTDARGETVDFHESVIIMTSNLGSDRTGDGGLGFTLDRAAAEASAIREEVQHFFRPEFINRIDRVVAFRRLSRATLRTVALREIGRCVAREGVVRRGIVVETDPSVADRVLEEGQSVRYGARQLKRAVEELVAVPLARLIASQRIMSDETVRLVAREGRIHAEVVREAPASQRAAPVRFGRHGARALNEIRVGLGGAGERVEHLAQVFDLSGTRIRADELRREMERPGFWDNATASAKTLRALAEANRLLERDKAARVALEEVGLLVDLISEGHREVLTEADQKLCEAEVEIEKMELETLLSAPNDRCPAYLVISAGGQSKEDEVWMRELVRLYMQWGEGRAMEVSVVAERGFRGSVRGAAVLYVNGPFAYGLLRSETGTHRRVFQSKENGRSAVVARIRVVAEPAEAGSAPKDLRYRATRAVSPRYITNGRGIVSFRAAGERWSLRTIYEAAAAAEFAILFAGALDACPISADRLATIARNVVFSPRQAVEDPRSQQQTTALRAYLDGEIDDFILACLAMEPAPDRSVHR
jgi:ATP-dependent Clp protease ATP-binding subunit ClpA